VTGASKVAADWKTLRKLAIYFGFCRERFRKRHRSAHLRLSAASMAFLFTVFSFSGLAALAGNVSDGDHSGRSLRFTFRRPRRCFWRAEFPINNVSELLGHASSVVTSRIYAHATKTGMARVTAATANLFQPVEAKTPSE
jgi:integrase